MKFFAISTRHIYQYYWCQIWTSNKFSNLQAQIKQQNHKTSDNCAKMTRIQDPFSFSPTHIKPHSIYIIFKLK